MERISFAARRPTVNSSQYRMKILKWPDEAIKIMYYKTPPTSRMLLTTEMQTNIANVFLST
jgi:hypothetical protein